MKLRIKGNSMRLRVSRTELSRFLDGQRVDETVHFSGHPTAKLTYALERSNEAIRVQVRCEPNAVTVVIPADAADRWGGDQEVGIYETLEIGRAGSLEVSVEKDYACLDQSDADNADTFANPQAGTIC